MPSPSATPADAPPSLDAWHAWTPEEAARRLARPHGDLEIAIVRAQLDAFRAHLARAHPGHPWLGALG